MLEGVGQACWLVLWQREATLPFYIGNLFSKQKKESDLCFWVLDVF